MENSDLDLNKLKDILQCVGEGIIYQVADGSIKFCNPTAQRIFGMGEDGAQRRISEHPQLNLVYEDGSPCSGEEHPSMITLHTGQALSGQIRGIARPGQPVTWLSINTRPIFRPGQELPEAVVISFNDITARKLAEDELKESQARYKAVFETNLAPKLLIDPNDGAIVDANQAASLFYGYSLPELKAMRIFDINMLPPDSVKQEMESARDKGRLVFQFLHRLKSGEMRDVEVYTGPVQDKGCTLLLSIVFDITDRKRAEEELRASEERFRLLYDSSPEAVFITRPDGSIQAANPAACQMFGYTEQEIIALGRNGLVDASDPRLDQLLAQRVANGQARGECTCLRKDGKPFPVELSGSIYTDGAGQIRSCVIMHDITERQRAREEKEQLEASLRHAQKLQAMGTLAGGIAHEFNNLLATIMGYSEIIINAAGSRKDLVSDAVQILKASERGRDLVLNILSFTRKAEPQSRPLDLNIEIRESKEMLGQLLPRTVSIETRLTPDLNLVNMDASHLGQILMNLITNACHAMPEGGKLVIKTENTAVENMICFACGERISGHYVLLSVADTGMGMDNEAIQRIYEPFFSTKQVGSGTGLGLSVVQGLVKSHGGHIACESEVGKGTTFNIFLPLLQSETVAFKTVSSSQHAVVGGTETILFVDDEESLRDIAHRYLSDVGYRVHLACNAEEALQVYRQHLGQIDLVVLDLGMAGMGGHKCLKEVLTINHQAKVVITSGYTTNGQDRQTLSSGASAFVGKPFKKAELLTTLRNVLDGN